MDIWPGRPFPLGPTASADRAGTNFALFSQRASAVDLCLFDASGNETQVPLRASTFHVWHGYVPGVAPGTHYGYRVDGDFNPAGGLRFNHNKLLVDPYARAIDGAFTLDDAVFGYPVATHDDTARDDRDSAPFVPRSVVVRDDFDWGADRPPAVAWADTLIYEVHVRGFTMAHPDIPQQLRGTYAGLVHPAALEHLTKLGVTTLELMP
ncbi:MAG TPA: glycogen debranching enzyme GlgX, partial [Acidothermaceae bacterium]